MKINLKNIEELIFYDRKLHKFFPEFQHFFSQWQLGQSIPSLKNLSKRSVIECLNSLESKHLKILEEYFKEQVLIDKIDDNIIATHENCIQNVEELCKFSNFQDFCITRDHNNYKITFWR